MYFKLVTELQPLDYFIIQKEFYPHLDSNRRPSQIKPKTSVITAEWNTGELSETE
jgi:hypothetical protein